MSSVVIIQNHEGGYRRIRHSAYKNIRETEELWYCKGKLHRDDGPAEIHYKNGQKVLERWYCNGKTHRCTGPAETHYENGQKIFERWLLYDELRRIDRGPTEITYENGQIFKEEWIGRFGEFSGNTLAYIRLANVDDFYKLRDPFFPVNSVDEFRNTVKGPLIVDLMKPLPIPIREMIIWHYCYQ